MKSLVDLKKELLEGKLNNLYIFTGEENLIRKIYYEKIASLHGNLKSLESVNTLFKELEKKPLFAIKTAYIVYNDMEFLKQREKVYQRLLKLVKDKVVILVYDEIPEKGVFNQILEEYITVFNKVTTDIAIKYVMKESKNKINERFAEVVAFNCNNSYNNIVEEMNKFKWLNEEDQNNIDAMDAIRYASIFIDRKVIPTPREFANAFIKTDISLLSNYIKILKEQNILGYLPELYNTIVLVLYLKIYGKWDGGSVAYNAGEYWGRIKELRDYNIRYSKDDLLDIRYLVNKLDLDIRSGIIKAEHAWDYLIGVIL